MHQLGQDPNKCSTSHVGAQDKCNQKPIHLHPQKQDVKDQESKIQNTTTDKSRHRHRIDAPCL